MMTDQAMAAAAVNRFENSIEWAARQMAELYPTVTTYEDAAQDARILVLSYSGYGDSGRHFGKLQSMEAEVAGDEARLCNLMAEQLRCDLKQEYQREKDKRLSAVAVEALPENRHPMVAYEDGIVAWVDKQRELLAEYPYLCRRFLRCETEREIAEADGTPLRTVEWRIAAEKARAAADPSMHHLAGAAGWEDGWEPPPEEPGPAFCTAPQYDRNGKYLGDCGTQFTVGSAHAVEHACSLSCWNAASDRRARREKNFWDIEFGGYHDDSETYDPRWEEPKLYEYKLWK